MYEEAEFHLYQVVNLCEQHKKTLCIQIKKKGGCGVGMEEESKLCQNSVFQEQEVFTSFITH